MRENIRKQNNAILLLKLLKETQYVKLYDIWGRITNLRGGFSYKLLV